jgi:elongation factor 1-beta
MRFYRTIERRCMSRIVVSLKIFPSDINISLNLLKTKIEKTLPDDVSVHKFEEEPIAFGLIALIAHIVMPEERSRLLDEIENSLREINEVSEIETIMVRRV